MPLATSFCLTITQHQHCKHTRHAHFSDHSRHGQLRIKTFSQTLFTFRVSHYPTPNMRPTPAMFQQAARSAPGFLQRLAKSPMSPPVEVLPILILPVGMVSLPTQFYPNCLSVRLTFHIQLSFAAYTGSREFKYDRNLRLKRTNVAAMQEHMQEH